MTHEIIWNLNFSWWRNLYWNTAALTRLHIRGCFCPAVAELSSCDRDHTDCKTGNIYCQALYGKRLLIPNLRMWRREAMGVSVVISDVLRLLWSFVVNSNAEILNLVLKRGLAVLLVVIETARPITFFFSWKLQDRWRQWSTRSKWSSQIS